MGTNASIKINAEWFEPSIIWFVIAARKGEKKTAALKRVRKPIEDQQKRIHEEWVNDDTEAKPTQPPQLIVDHFSFEELHSMMCRNHSQILGLFDEMSTFYGHLDLYKHSSTVDRKTLLTLNMEESLGLGISSPIALPWRRPHLMSRDLSSQHSFTKC